MNVYRVKGYHETDKKMMNANGVHEYRVIRDDFDKYISAESIFVLLDKIDKQNKSVIEQAAKNYTHEKIEVESIELIAPLHDNVLT